MQIGTYMRVCAAAGHILIKIWEISTPLPHGTYITHGVYVCRFAEVAPRSLASLHTLSQLPHNVQEEPERFGSRASLKRIIAEGSLGSLFQSLFRGSQRRSGKEKRTTK